MHVCTGQEDARWPGHHLCYPQDISSCCQGPAAQELLQTGVHSSALGCRGISRGHGRRMQLR